MGRLLRRLIRIALLLIALIVAIPLIGFAYGYLATSDVTLPDAGGEEAAPPTELRQRVLAEIPGYQRPEDATFLTYPEWSIVYAAREYADHVEDRWPSEFPYWAYIARYWRDYAIVARATADYPVNVQNHVMLVVIGTSHTLEHVIEWAYEHSLGLATSLIAGEPVAEDRMRARVAAEYAAFLDQVPWYRFDYSGKRRALWAQPAAPGIGAIRSWERRLGLGLAYTVKQAYADLISAGLSATSDPALLDIHVWAKGSVGPSLFGEPDSALELDFGENGAIFVTKRYQAFTDLVPRLVDDGVRFVEIGGNDLILVTFLSTDPVAAPAGSANLFAYAIPAEDRRWRTGIVVPVYRLHEVIPALAEADATLEHVYDY